MFFKTRENISCDVLVVGGGGAGLRSAITAKLNHADVVLASKTRVGPNSNTYISKAVIASTGWGSSEDGESAHLVDTVRGGRFLNDQSMVAEVAQRTHAEIVFLKDCGVGFDQKAGNPRLIKIPGHRYPRHVYGKNWCGSDLVSPLKRRAVQVGVRFADRVFVTRLLAIGNRICGAAGISSDGRFYGIRAKAVVLATGGYAQIYRNTNNVPGITGDGQALAFELGVPLKDMEFVQFYPTAMGRRGSRLILYEKLLAQPGVILRNGQGQDILAHHGITDLATLTRDRLAQLMTMEIKPADSSEGDVFMDTQALTDDAAGRLSSILPSKWWKGQKVFKVTPTTHFCMGGIVTDPCGETSLAGLFAVGEATAGVHGANRLGGNALAEIFTMGALVGQRAAERALDIGASAVPGQVFEKERSRLEAVHSPQGLSAAEVIAKLKQMMWDKAGVIRQAKELGEALKRLEEPCPRVAVSNPAELIRFLEYKNMRCVAKLVCRAANERTESRGAHFRSDHPAEDNRRWLKNIVLRKSGTDIHLEARPVTLDRVKLDS